MLLKRFYLINSILQLKYPVSSFFSYLKYALKVFPFLLLRFLNPTLPFLSNSCTISLDTAFPKEAIYLSSFQIVYLHPFFQLVHPKLFSPSTTGLPHIGHFPTSSKPSGTSTLNLCKSESSLFIFSTEFLVKS